MKQHINIGILSLGGAGRAHLLRYRSNPRSRVVALYDPREDVLDHIKTVSKLPQVQLLTSDIDDFFSFRGLDAVSICSPDHTHAEYALRCIEHDWHVLCEKPLADSLDDCERIIKAVANSGVKFMVHHQWRFVPAFLEARNMVRSQKIGNVFSIEADYFHDMTDRATRFDNWRIDRNNPQNIVLGGACHPIDLVQWILGDQISEVFAYANHLSFPSYPDVDNVIAVLKFSGGQVGKVTMSIGCKRPQYQRLAIYGDKGTVQNNLLLDNNGLVMVTARPHLLLNSPLSFAKSIIKNSIGYISSIPGVTIEYPFGDYYEHDLASEALINSFIECVISGKPEPIPLKESVDAIRVGLAIIESYKVGQAIRINR